MSKKKIKDYKYIDQFNRYVDYDDFDTSITCEEMYSDDEYASNEKSYGYDDELT